MTDRPTGDCRHGHDWRTYGRLGADGRWRCGECARLANVRSRSKLRAVRTAVKLARTRAFGNAWTIVDWLAKVNDRDDD